MTYLSDLPTKVQFLQSLSHVPFRSPLFPPTEKGKGVGPCTLFRTMSDPSIVGKRFSLRPKVSEG